MPKAARIPITSSPLSPSRRVVLRSVIAAAAAAIPGARAATIVAPALDTGLIALCDALLANEAESDALCEPFYETPGGWSARPEVAARVEALTARHHALAEAIAATPARTPAGWRAKARAALTKIDTDTDGEVLCDDDAMAWSLCQDLLRVVPV